MMGSFVPFIFFCVFPDYSQCLRLEMILSLLSKDFRLESKLERTRPENTAIGSLATVYLLNPS